MEGPVLIKDSREPAVAWDEYFKAPMIVRKLDTGDYSVDGLETMIAIERKTLDDLVGCLGKGRARFERELERSQALDYFAVIVEEGYAQLATGNYRSQLNPRAAVESISAFEVRYGTHFLFAGSQELAARKCESLLVKFWREQQKQLDGLAATIMAIPI